jgi:hypothetical protein
MTTLPYRILFVNYFLKKISQDTEIALLLFSLLGTLSKLELSSSVKKNSSFVYTLSMVVLSQASSTSCIIAARSSSVIAISAG